MSGLANAASQSKVPPHSCRPVARQDRYITPPVNRRSPHGSLASRSLSPNWLHFVVYDAPSLQLGSPCVQVLGAACGTPSTPSTAQPFHVAVLGKHLGFDRLMVLVLAAGWKSNDYPHPLAVHWIVASARDDASHQSVARSRPRSRLSCRHSSRRSVSPSRPTRDRPAPR